MDIKELKRQFNDFYFISDSYSKKEIESINKTLDSKPAQDIIKKAQKLLPAYQKTKKKAHEMIGDAKKPIEKELNNLADIIKKSLENSEDSYLRTGMSSVWEKAAKKAGIPKIEQESGFGDDDGETQSSDYTIKFKSKGGKEVQIDYWADDMWWDDDDREWVEEKNPEIDNMEIKYDGKEISCIKHNFYSMKKATVEQIAPKYLEDLYSDDLDYFK